MSEVILNDIPVNFPFEPYDVQKEYMRKVLECLQKGVNGVLESPTGTGKTLSLLCSSLAWLEIKKAQIQATIRLSGNSNNSMMQSLNDASGVTKAENQSWGGILGMPKIIYASRTHTQLAQAVTELKRTKYNYMKVAVLGSRDQLCIHPEVSREPNAGLKIGMCRTKVSSRSCHFYNNVDKCKNDASLSAAIMDIEDLAQKGRKLMSCPYYLSRELHKNADIVFVPYNYLLDARIRDLQDIQLANNVIILDEAHNVEKVCEESASFQLSSTDIAICIMEVTHVMKDMHEQMQSKSFDDASTAKDFTADDLCILKAMFTELEQAVDAIDLTTGRLDDNRGAAFPGSHVLNVLAKADITPDKLLVLIEILHNVSQYLTITSESSYQHRGAGLQKFHDFIKVVAKSLGSEHDRETADKFYKLYVEPEVSKKGKTDAWATKISSSKNNPKILNFWCFSASLGMRSLIELGVRSIILTSGTLAPLEATIMELGIPVDVKLENPHIVQANQVCVSVVKVGPTNKELKSTYENRSNVNYLKELALTLQNFSRVVPHGLLVFFPSYYTMESTVSFWQEQGLWSKIAAIKPMFVEPHHKEALNEVMKQYYEAVDSAESSKGATLLAVCRGKVSEGLDFANGRGRAVIVTGLPFPPFKDPRVILKRQFIDQNRNAVQTLTGMEWYRLEATRAVNQAVGRVIRHAKDYGAIILCDSRFSLAMNTKSLSKWLQPHVKQCDHFRIAYSGLVSFYRNIGAQKSLLREAASSASVGASFMYSDSEMVVRDRKEKTTEEEEEEEYKRKLEMKIAAKREMFRQICNGSSLSFDKKPAETKPQPKNLLDALDCAEQETNNSVCCNSSSSGTPPSCSSSKRSNDVTCDSDDSDHDTRIQGVAMLQDNSTKKRRVKVMSRSYKENELITSPPPQLVVPSSSSSSSTSSASLSTSSSSSSSVSGYKQDTARLLINDITIEKATAILNENQLALINDKECLKQKVAAYWWLVKRALDDEMFQVFKMAVMDYRSKLDVQKTLESLKSLFPIDDPDMHILFKGFFNILIPRDKEQFKQFCDTNNIS